MQGIMSQEAARETEEKQASSVPPPAKDALSAVRALE